MGNFSKDNKKFNKPVNKSRKAPEKAAPEKAQTKPVKETRERKEPKELKEIKEPKETAEPVKPEIKDGSFDTIIVGSRFLDDMTPLKELKDGDKLSLALEPGNEHDPNAVRVDDARGRKLGFIPKGKDRDHLFRLMMEGHTIEAEIDDAVSLSVKINFHKK